MTELVIIKTDSIEKLKTVLDKNHIKHEIVYNEILADKKTSKKDKLREQSISSFSKLRQYIEMKSKEDIFSDYGKALKDKGKEKEMEEIQEKNNVRL
jgi:hypothetical protein